LFLLPGLIALGVLSWAYAEYGNIGAVNALFFRFEERGARHRDRGGAAIGQARIEAAGSCGHRRAGHSPASSFSRFPFPVLIAGAAFPRMDFSCPVPQARAIHRETTADIEGGGIIDAAFDKNVRRMCGQSLARLVRIALVGLALWA
jgi:chromate transporter